MATEKVLENRALFCYAINVSTYIFAFAFDMIVLGIALL